MGQSVKDSGNPANRLLSQLAAERKKAVTAFCLVAVMAFMWVRVLTKKAPEAAEAALATQQTDVAGQSNPELRISFVELPEAAGRNDVITRDFFDSDGWEDFLDEEVENLAGIEEVNVVSRDGDEEVIRRVTKRLKLEAIVLGENPQACINDKPLSVGDKLVVSDGVERYECEVVEIREKAVVIRCRDAEITLKLKQMVENSR